MDKFLHRLTAVIREGRLLPRGAKLVVAVSGGLDSMVLLNALERLQDTFKWELEAAHFNHGLRGRAATADERLVCRTCESLLIPCSVGHWPPSARAAAIKAGGTEQAAREARRSFLGEVARRLGARHVVLAHHADDQVETFFVRLLRGAGSLGLGGMRSRVRHGPPLNAWLVRPFLDFRREELAAWARTQGLKFREDASNRDPRFLRNRVRHHLLPALVKEFSPATSALVLRTMKSLADEADFLRQTAADFLRLPPDQRPSFDDCAPALQRQVLALQLEALRLKFDWELIEALRSAPDTVFTGPDQRHLARDAAGTLVIHKLPRLAFDHSAVTVRLQEHPRLARLAGLEVRWSLKYGQEPLKFLPGCEQFDAARIGPEVVLRHWRPGDRFQPIGLKQSAKLQDLFTNAKVAAAERRRRAVAVAASGEIFWVEGLRIGEHFKLTPATRTRLIWRWRRTARDGHVSASRKPATTGTSNP